MSCRRAETTGDGYPLYKQPVIASLFGKEGTTSSFRVDETATIDIDISEKPDYVYRRYGRLYWESQSGPAVMGIVEGGSVSLDQRVIYYPAGV